MKKITALLLVTAMVCMSLAGCGSKTADNTSNIENQTTESTNKTENEETKETTQDTAHEITQAVTEEVESDATEGKNLTGKKVGFSALLMSSEFFTDMSNQMEEYFTSRGMEYYVADANANAQTQIQTIENFVSMGMDYIICFVVDAASISDALVKARENGAFVIVIGTILDNKDAYDVCINISQYESGRVEAEMAAEWIEKTFPDAADRSIKVGLLYNTENEDAVDRSNGLREIENLTSKAVIVEEHETLQSEGAATAQTYAEMMLMNNPDMNVILTYGTDQGQGANEAVMKDSNINKNEFAVFTVDTAEFIRNKIKGSVTGDSVIRGTVMLGEGTPMTCYNIMDGTWMNRVKDKVYSEECIKITPETIGQYFPD